MLRKDREIKDWAELESFIRQTRVCRLGIRDDEYPYVVPLCFGYESQTLYFHCHNRGKKLELLKKDHRVCFEMDRADAIRPGKKICAWGLGFESIIGRGNAVFIDDPAEKRRALDIIISHYAPEGSPDAPLDFSDTALKNTVIFKIPIIEMTGKRS